MQQHFRKNANARRIRWIAVKRTGTDAIRNGNKSIHRFRISQCAVQFFFSVFFLF